MKGRHLLLSVITLGWLVTNLTACQPVAAQRAAMATSAGDVAVILPTPTPSPEPTPTPPPTLTPAPPATEFPVGNELTIAALQARTIEGSAITIEQ